MTFAQFKLNQNILDNLTRLNYECPSPIQKLAIPEVMHGKNILAAAQTGTGKTASFILPILERLSQGKTQKKKRIRALVLTPTRELALQVDQVTKEYAANTGIRSLAMYGGTVIAEQKKQLIEGIDILIATPGRLLDMYHQRAVYFEEIETVVLDEADRMLDMGFIDAINNLLEKMPQGCQTLLFSATLSKKVRALAKTALNHPVEINAEKTYSKPDITQWLTTVDKDKKSSLLSHLIHENQWKKALIFVETKHGAAKLVEQLAKRGIVAESFHSGRSQVVREQLLKEFTAGDLKYLVATGVVARGIDIQNLPLVINYDLPYPPEDYVHRIGRTGRAGAKGEAISFLSKDDFKNLCMIESRLGHLIDRREIEGFSPKKPVPISILNYVPKSKRR